MKSTVYMELGAEVDRARQRKGMSVRQVADAAQLDRGTVRRLLGGGHVCVSSLRMVLDAVDLELDQVVRRLARRWRAHTPS